MSLSVNADSSNQPIIITYFAQKQLVVGNDQLFFLCCFGNIFDVSQQLMLIEKLQEKMQLGRES